MKQSLSEVTFESFEPLVGKRVQFDAMDPAGTVHTFLFEVESVQVNRRVAELTQAGQPGSLYRRIPFSVVFRAEEEPPFKQAVLRLVHESMVDCDLMVTRVMASGLDPSQAWFEAVFG